MLSIKSKQVQFSMEVIFFKFALDSSKYLWWVKKKKALFCLSLMKLNFTSSFNEYKKIGSWKVLGRGQVIGICRFVLQELDKVAIQKVLGRIWFLNKYESQTHELGDMS